MGIFDSIKNVIVNASYYSATKTAQLFGLTPIKPTDTAKEVATKSAKNVVAEATTLLVGKGISKIPVNAKTVLGGSVIGTAGTGYILSTEKPINTLKEVATIPQQTSSAIFDLGSTAGSFSLEKSKEENFGIAKDYAIEHPLATALIGTGAAYLGGKATSSIINLANTQAIKENTKTTEKAATGGFTEMVSDKYAKDIAETNAEANLKIAKLQAETQIKLAQEQTKQLEYQAKQTAQQQAISTPTTPSVVPVTKKKTTKKKTTKKKSKKKPVTKKKSKKISKSKKKR